MENKLNNLIVKLINEINKIVKNICIFLVIILFTLLTAGVLSRYIFNSPIIWENEFSLILFVWFIFLGITIAFFEHQHIVINIFIDALPQIARNFFNILVKLSIFIFSIIVVKEGFRLIQAFSLSNFRTIPISLGWLYAAPTVSFILVLFYNLVPLSWKQDKVKKQK